ncbi:hypothetical protein WKY82_08290 [Gordonia malaquae]|uniref:hypothetical protein n=1 Tax=Gordonia malaquae TaxID=410332 RepID=UPI0030C79A0E
MRLGDAYRRAPNSRVAFLDESFEVAEDRTTFYLVSAVVTDTTEIDVLRDGLIDVVGDHYWHTTESLLTPSGRKRAIELAEYLGHDDGREVAVVACKAPIGEAGGDAARQACIEQVAQALCTGAGIVQDPVHLMVLEQRETLHERSFDNMIISKMRKAGAICRHCQLMQASPRDESLLWLPDLVSSAVRRQMTHQEDDLLGPIFEIVEVIDCP